MIPVCGYTTYTCTTLFGILAATTCITCVYFSLNYLLCPPRCKCTLMDGHIKGLMVSIYVFYEQGHKCSETDGLSVALPVACTLLGSKLYGNRQQIHRTVSLLHRQPIMGLELSIAQVYQLLALVGPGLTSFVNHLACMELLAQWWVARLVNM